jgi:hypothetical protein
MLLLDGEVSRRRVSKEEGEEQKRYRNGERRHKPGAYLTCSRVDISCSFWFGRGRETKSRGSSEAAARQQRGSSEAGEGR